MTAEGKGMSWADRAAPIVGEVIRRIGRSDQQALRKALAEAYPWGERKNTPPSLAWVFFPLNSLEPPLF